MTAVHLWWGPRLEEESVGRWVGMRMGSWNEKRAGHGQAWSPTKHSQISISGQTPTL